MQHSCQGEFLGMRLVENDIDMGENSSLQNALRFDDGAMRALAGALVWCGLIYYTMTLKDEEICHPAVADLARGLLSIPTMYKTQGNEAMAMISRIIRQNVEAKKQSVSSYEWSMILRGLSEKGKGNQTISLQEAIELYNGNPEVSAHGTGSAKDCLPMASGMGSPCSRAR